MLSVLICGKVLSIKPLVCCDSGITASLLYDMVASKHHCIFENFYKFGEQLGDCQNLLINLLMFLL